MWIRGSSSSSPSTCLKVDVCFGELCDEGFVGVDAPLEGEESLRGLPRFLDEALEAGDVLSLPTLDGLFGEGAAATIISSSIVSFTGIRCLGIVNGLKKSLMLLLPCFGGIASSKRDSSVRKFVFQAKVKSDALEVGDATEVRAAIRTTHIHSSLFKLHSTHPSSPICWTPRLCAVVDEG
jgi:hypothetical protein